jgi:hypothetical protein
VPGDWLIEHTGAPLNLARGGGSDRRRIAEMLITGMTVAEVNTAAKRLSRWAECCADVLINGRSDYIRLRKPSAAHAT